MNTNDSAIDSVLLWMVSGLSGAKLEAACITKLGIDPPQVSAVIAEARKRLLLAADYNRDELLGTALTRLNDLYNRCIRAESGTGGNGAGPNLAKALDVQREINRLTGLYQPLGISTQEPDDGDSFDDFEAVREHLLPLKLAGKEYPIQEHARLAVMRIEELEAKLKLK